MAFVAAPLPQAHFGMTGAWGVQSAHHGYAAVLMQVPSPVTYPAAFTAQPAPAAWLVSHPAAMCAGYAAPVALAPQPVSGPFRGGERRQKPVTLLLTCLLPSPPGLHEGDDVSEVLSPKSSCSSQDTPRLARTKPRRFAGSRVRFDLGACTVHEVTPYEETYGVHPREFVFDRHFCMIPLGRDGRALDERYGGEDADSDDDF